jgi:hypothetical protein|tara:strand:+ start:2901 stop:3242 length:342 start_codon:yes stop_codon:yes gene_type:complete
MSVYVNNIVINSGESFTLPLTVLDSAGDTPLNLTGYAVTSMMRKHAESTTKTTQFVVGITSAVEGAVTLSLASTTTSTIKSGRYVYDVLLTADDDTKSIAVEGSALVRLGISS